MKVLASATLLTTISWTTCLAAKEQPPLRRRVETNDDDNDAVHFPFQSRIVGGTLADARNYEYSVYLGGCGGSLIYEDLVLTAAHCQPIYPSTARIGGSRKTNGVEKDIVGYGTKHPRYSERSQDFDFMLYKLGSPVTELTPVVLNSEFSIPSSGDPLTVIGFGSTFEGGPGSINLREVGVSHVAHNTCNAAYRGQVEEDIMFCAGVDGGGRDSCQGDSGGPIVSKDGVQVGVTSWGNGCANDGYPGVYARVSAVYDWIQDNICSMSDNPPATCTNGEGGNGNGNGGSSNGDSNGNGGSSNGGSNGNGGNSNGSGGGSDNNESGTDNPDSDLIQPKGISLRVDIKYDNYPEESAWVLYNDDTKEELYWSDYGDVKSPGLKSKVFTDLLPGKYVFLMLDEYWDGICCSHGEGYVQVFEVYPPETGRGDELRWSHDGKFVNAAGAAFWVLEEDDRRELSGSVELDGSDDIEDSPYLP